MSLMPEFYSGEDGIDRFVDIIARAGELGLRLYVDNPNLESGEPVVVNRAELMEYAEAHDFRKVHTEHSWLRMQRLYMSKVRYETTGVTSKLPVTTPLIFRESLPLDFVKPELPESWDDWANSLGDLDAESLRLFVMQLKNVPAKAGNLNPYNRLLGKGSSPRMFELLKGFSESLDK